MTIQHRTSILLILLLALAVRVFQLDTQSIWYDEGLSIQLAQQPPAQALALSATTDHPPLHTLLLGGWLRLAGDSDFSVRYLSVLWGVLLVALTYAVGALLDRRAALIGAALMALAPSAVYYSQETRGYTQLSALSLIAVLALLRLLRGDARRRVWLAYGLALIAALYTHYFAAFIWAAMNVAWLIVWAMDTLTRRAVAPAPVRRWLGWLLAQAIILLAFAPWLPNALAQAGSNATYFPGRVTWDTVVSETWRAFTVGEWGAPPTVVGALWLFFSVAGAIYLWWRRREVYWARTSVVLVCWLFVPVLSLAALAWLKPKFAPRYLLPALPALLLLAAVGVSALVEVQRSRFCRLGSIGVVLALALPLGEIAALMPLYLDPGLARPDMRAAVAYIEAHDDATDAILLIGGHQAPAFEHYYRGDARVVPLPPDLLPAPQRPLDARALDRLAQITAQHPRVWLVLWQNELSDPMNVISDALLARGQRLPVGENFHGMGLLLFDVRAARFDKDPQFVVDFTFAEPLRLVGYNVNSSRTSVDTPLQVALYLTADGRITGNYQVFLHVLDASGRLIAQADHIAGADSFPTALWPPGSLIVNRFEVALPAATPPGEYPVIVGLYDERGRLPLTTGRDHIALLSITVVP